MTHPTVQWTCPNWMDSITKKQSFFWLIFFVLNSEFKGKCRNIWGQILTYCRSYYRIQKHLIFPVYLGLIRFQTPVVPVLVQCTCSLFLTFYLGLIWFQTSVVSLLAHDSFYNHYLGLIWFQTSVVSLLVHESYFNIITLDLSGFRHL